MIGPTPITILLLSLSANNNNNGGSNKATTPNSLATEVAAARKIRKTGFLAGSGLIAAATSVGLAGGLIDAKVLLEVAAFSSISGLIYTLTFDEQRSSLDESYFEVKASEIEGAGMGLFATKSIPSSAFLFPYTGERLTETEYFERYPQGDSRYIAEIPGAPWSGDEPAYIDGINKEISGLARWMNSKPDEIANVFWKKQRFGKHTGMYFYTKCDIKAGEEMCFNYGDQYWDAVVRQK
eukprot:6818870-Ditylum_brightwellii.AAC.1